VGFGKKNILLSIAKWLQHHSWIVAISSSVVMSVIVEVMHYFSFFLLAFLGLRHGVNLPSSLR
jgi:hypothetical protein